MIRNYLVVAWRSLRKQPLYSTINILGLAIGLTSFLLIFLYLQDEYTYDHMHPDHEETYRLSYWRQWDNGNVEAFAISGGQWGPRLVERFPEVVDVIRLTHSAYPTHVNEQGSQDAFMEPHFYWAEDNFLDFFDLQLVQGEKETVFAQLDNVLISASSAKKYFGDENPLGQVLEYNHRSGTIPLTVSGVYRDAPSNSHMKPEMIANFVRLNQQTIQTWDWDPFTSNFASFMYTYVKLTDANAIPKIQEDWLAYIQETLGNNPNANAADYKELKLTALSDLHFEPEMTWELEAPADSAYLPIFIIAGILVLVIACINFMNLATARSAKRAREVGLRKTLGSTKRQLVIQFYGESFLISFVSVLLSAGAVILLLKPFNQLAGKTFVWSDLVSPPILMVLLLLTLLVTLLSGSYPALYLSSFKPIAALRGLFGSGRGAENIRKALVVFQFGVSIILIIATLVVYSQLQLINTSKLGQDKDRILSIRLGGFGLGDGWIPFRDQVEQDARFEAVTVGNHLPRLPHFGLINRTFRLPESNNEEREWSKFDVDFNFPEVFELEFIAGRNFDPQLRSDSTAILLNEAALLTLQMAPEEVIGMTIRDRVWNPQLQQQVDLDGKVIGIVKDFPFKSVETAIEPLAIWGSPSPVDRILYVKMTPGSYQDKIAVLDKLWKEINPGLPMENWFMDFEFARLYENERRMSSIFILFSVITIFIAAMGLFALASYVTEQRKKEIGLRKVLGASSKNLVGLLLSHFFKLIAIAFVVAIPIAWYAMNDWLNGFVYRVDLSVWIFLVAGFGVSLITFLTVGYDTYRAAISNPVKVLRTE
ncbi:MAG: FtsX-like permease family protein [Bacteroidota bacterium]